MARKQTTPEEPSFWKYLELIKEKLPTVHYDSLRQHMFENKALGNCLDAGPCMIHLLDYRTKHYAYISKNVEDITGYAADMFYRHGVSLSLSLYHPDDQAIFINQIFKRKLAFLHATLPSEHKGLRFSYNYRLRRRDGVYIHMVQQSFVAESDSAGNPLLHFGVCSDISPYKSDDGIILTISKRNESGEYTRVLLECFPKCGDKALSRREIEIVKLVMAGMNSKAIADKLFLGLHTVRTHRRNMMKKIHAKNTADVLRYAVLHGIV